MTIELSGNDTLKIVLDRNDMRRLNLTFEELDYDNQETRFVLKELLADAGRLTGFSSKCAQLLIEAFPAPDGGCLLYFTKLPASRQTLSSHSALKLKKESLLPVSQYVFEFARCEDLLAGTDFLARQKVCRPPIFGSLYEKNSAYRLVLGWDIPGKDAENFFCEFGKYVGRGPHVVAATAEHWNLVRENDVLEKLRA